MSIRTYLLLLLLCIVPLRSHAHSSSEAYLNLQLEAGYATGVWEFALQDLEHDVGVDSNGDGTISWSEIKKRKTVILQYILGGIQLIQDGDVCRINPGEIMLNNRHETVFLYLPVNVECSRPIVRLDVQYHLFFERDIRHHAMWMISSQDNTFSRISSADNRYLHIDFSKPGSSEGFAEFIVQGIWHIWIGLDHILFVLLLMFAVENSLQSLPSKQWRAQRWRRLVKMVTAFTLAHSLTLVLATSAWFELPALWVESIIALSVIVAGLNVLFNWIEERLWLFAFGFGLIHGFGFASVLLDLGVDGTSLLVNLLAFNIGIECGQLVIIVLSLPLVIALRKLEMRGIYIRQLLTTAMIMLASIWLIQRATI